MALDPNKKFLYFNKDESATEMDLALCFPVSSFIGIETQTSGVLHLYFKGSKGADATIIQVIHEQYAYIKSFMLALVDEINFGDKAFIKVHDRAEYATYPSDVTINMSVGSTPTFTLEGDELLIAGDVRVNGSFNFDGTGGVNRIDYDTAFTDNDLGLMTSKAINSRFAQINADTTGNAANLTASTSTAVGLGTIELGHATDTTIARSAAGTVTIEGKQVFTTNTPALTSAAAGVPAVTMQVRRTITSAEADAMDSTSIVLVPAQGANTVIVPLSGMVRVDRAAAQTNSAADWNLHYDGQRPGVGGLTSLMHIRRFMYGQTVDTVYHVIPSLTYNETGQNLTNDVDKNVEVSFDAATSGGCFTSIEVYLTYQIFNIA